MSTILAIPCERKYFRLLKSGKISYAIAISNHVYKVGVNLQINEVVKGVSTNRIIPCATITHILNASKYSLQPNTVVLTLSIKF
jgi:hypothetical protein